MPISRDEFEKGEARDSIKARAKELLQNNPDKAYTIDEIHDYLFGKNALNVKSVDAAAKSLLRDFILSEVLSELYLEGHITSKVVHTKEGKKTYYAWKT